jgi:hypothetical protein
MKVKRETILELFHKAKANAYNSKDMDFLGNIWYCVTHTTEPWLSRKQYTYLRSLAHATIRSEEIDIID